MAEKIEPYKGIAVIYDEIRPSYPEVLIQDIIFGTGLKTGDKLLEIGAGTGKATVQFAEKGFDIDAVELGYDMAEILKIKCDHYPKVKVYITPFEEWNSLDNQRYDMIYSAQAFHWLEASTKYKKCHEYLKDDGYLVLFWYNPGEDESKHTKQINMKVEAVIHKYAAKFYDKGKPERRVHSGISENDERKEEIEASGLFRVVEKIEYTQEIKNNAEQYIKVRKSVPAFASILDGLDDEVIEKMDNEIMKIINSNGGYVGSFFNFSLYITKKK